MKAALLPERGVVKVAGEDARKFLNGLLTADIAKVTPQRAAYAALLTPQGKIMVDMIVAEAPAEDGGGFFLDCPRALAPTLVDRLNFYKLRAKVIVEDLSEVLGVMAVWDGAGDDRIRPLLRRPAPAGARLALHAAAASRRRGRRRPRRHAGRRRATTRRTASRSACRAAGSTSTTTTPSRTKPTWTSSTASTSTRAATSARRSFRASSIAAPRASAWCRSRSRTSPPEAGVAVKAGDIDIGVMGSSVRGSGRGLAMLRLDRVAEALAAGKPLIVRRDGAEPVKPDWARFDWPGEAKAAE